MASQRQQTLDTLNAERVTDMDIQLLWEKGESIRLARERAARERAAKAQEQQQAETNGTEE